MDQYEYRIETTATGDTDRLRGWLMAFGLEGWELCAVLPPEDDDGIHLGTDRPHPRFVFKRCAAGPKS